MRRCAAISLPLMMLFSLFCFHYFFDISCFSMPPRLSFIYFRHDIFASLRRYAVTPFRCHCHAAAIISRHAAMPIFSLFFFFFFFYACTVHAAERHHYALRQLHYFFIDY
jgi:hypothetical protein